MALATDLVIPPIPFGPASGVPGAIPFVVTGEDNLRLEAWSRYSNVQGVTFAWRMILPDRTVQAFQTDLRITTTDGSRNRQDVKLGAGILLNLSAYWSGAFPVQIGETFVRASLIRGLGGGVLNIGTLCQGYVTDDQSVAWPGSPLRDAFQGSGTMLTFAQGAPGAGAQFTISVEPGQRWRFQAVHALLTTDANAGTRRPIMNARDAPAGNILWNTGQPVGLGPSASARFSWLAGAEREDGITPGNSFAVGVLPNPCILHRPHQLFSSLGGAQPGDAWTNITWMVEVWLVPYA